MEEEKENLITVAAIVLKVKVIKIAKVEKIKEKKKKNYWAVALVKIIALEEKNNSQAAFVCIKSGPEFNMY